MTAGGSAFFACPGGSQAEESWPALLPCSGDGEESSFFARPGGSDVESSFLARPGGSGEESSFLACPGGSGVAAAVGSPGEEGVAGGVLATVVAGAGVISPYVVVGGGVVVVAADRDVVAGAAAVVVALARAVLLEAADSEESCLFCSEAVAAWLAA